MLPESRRTTTDLPRWVRILDGLAVAMLVALLCLVSFGPIRFDVGVAHLSVTSYGRLLFWLTLALAARHLAWPTPALHWRMWEGVRRAVGSPTGRHVLPQFVASRIAVLAVGYLAVVTIGYPQGAPPLRVSENEVVNLPLRWDTGWYLGIATQGYRWSADVDGQQNIAFFPAYPLLVRAGGALLNAGNEPVGLVSDPLIERYYSRHLTAGLLIALGAFAWALVYVHRLAREDLSAASAGSVITLLCAYPFALFFSAAHTESLLLLAATAAFYHVRRH